MKQFQVLRYIKKWRYLIAAVMIIGGLGFYYYAAQKQTYVASVKIRYTNSGATEGLAPDGTKIDVSEILSSRVINGVLNDLRFNGSVEGIRSNCKIEEIIPEDETLLKAALLDQGKEYTYFPTDYTVKYTASSSYSPEFARRVVSAILDNYFRSYTESYISDAVLPNNAANLIGSDYDYIEQIDLLEKSISDIMSFLSLRNENYSGFRSSQTGYKFSDLYAIYDYIYNTTMPCLYSQVIDEAISKSASVMASKFSQSILAYNRNYDNAQKQLANLDKIISEYASKLSEGLSAEEDVDGTNSSGKPVLQSVYDWDHGGVVDRTLTYDELISRRIQYQLEMKNIEIYRTHDTDLFNVFKSTADSTNEKLDAEIAALIAQLSDIYDLLIVTYNEFNEYRVAHNIDVLSNINVREGLNVKLYLTLAVVVFLVFGCFGAILLGRSEDVMEYLIYNDKKTGLPNRARCDQEIIKYEGALLKDNFCCVVLSLDNLRSSNDKQGYALGNAMLRQLSLLLKDVTNRLGFVGYNNAGEYLCLFEDCTFERAESMKKRLLEMIEQYNHSEPTEDICVSIAIACSTTDKEYGIKALVRLAYTRLRNKA